jgi:hypothetical protein
MSFLYFVLVKWKELSRILYYIYYYVNQKHLQCLTGTPKWIFHSVGVIPFRQNHPGKVYTIHLKYSPLPLWELKKKKQVCDRVSQIVDCSAHLALHLKIIVYGKWPWCKIVCFAFLTFHCQNKEEMACAYKLGKIQIMLD